MQFEGLRGNAWLLFFLLEEKGYLLWQFFMNSFVTIVAIVVLACMILLNGFQQNGLVHRKFKIRTQLLVERVQRIVAVHDIDPVKAFDTGQGDSVSVIHIAKIRIIH